MEINSKITTCPKCGNFYDAARYTACPNCQNGEANGSFSPTMPIGGSSDGASFSSTMPIGGGSPGMAGGNFQKTKPLDYAPASAANSQFPPTMIGGDSVSGGTDPVVGWLICIEGPGRGSDYRLHAGYNYIGREQGDVRIPGDQQISRQSHAMVAYDEETYTYFVGPSAGRNLIRVNGKPVLNAVEIKNYDVITVGTTKLMFVGLCGSHFSWRKD